MRCDNCKAWVKNLDKGQGDCRFHAPKPKFADGKKDEIVWPRTPEDSWCMNFVERKEV